MQDLLDGLKDLPLNEAGRAHIKSLSEVFKKIDDAQKPACILYSPLKRCEETKDILQSSLALTHEPNQYEDLKEVYRGDWRTLAPAIKEQAANFLKEKKYPALASVKVDDAEEWGCFLKRIEKVIGECLEPHKGKCPIIVTHGQVIKEFLKMKKCWAEFNLEEKWRGKGDDRLPIKVTCKDEVWTAELME
jgi:broad specificity phosphatase PhoE